MNDFGSMVRKARESRRISLAALAEELEFTPVHLSEVERGRRNPPGDSKVKAWARFLDLSVEDVLTAARESVDVIKIPVNRDSRKAEVALAFLREMDGMSDERREQLLAILNRGEPNG